MASADALPVPDQSFSLILCFEVIEHISGWKDLLSEAARVLTRDGVFLVSTPNKSYYAETRQSVGPNPFHVHEFEREEFRSALGEAFSHVVLMAQNHQQVLAFAGENSAHSLGGYLAACPALADAHFFIAICSHEPVQASAFVYADSCGNLLKERETYIRLLKQEVDSLTKELKSTQANFISARGELVSTQANFISARGELVSTQEELASVREELASAISKLISVQGELIARSDELAELRSEFFRLQEQFEKVQGEKRVAAQSKWLRLGNRLGLGPNLREKI